SGQHGNRWAESAHADVLSDYNLPQTSRIKCEDVFDRFVVLDARNRVGLIVIHVARSDNENPFALRGNALGDGIAQFSKGFEIAGADRNGHKTQPRLPGLKEGKLHLDRVLASMSGRILSQRRETMPKIIAQFGIGRNLTEWRLPRDACHDRQRISNASVIGA